MKKLIYIFVLVLLILGSAACGSSEPKYQEQVREGWENLSDKDRRAACLAYDLYGPEYLETLVNEDSDLPEAEVGARINLLEEEC